MISLKPLGVSTKKRPNFAVSDVESFKWINHLITGYYHKAEDGFETLQYFLNLSDYVRFVVSDENPSDIIFAHNGGKFDFLFWIKEGLNHPDIFIEGMIPRGSSMLCYSMVLREFTNDRKLIRNILSKQKKKFIRYHDDGIYYRKRVVKFYDSTALLPFSLKKLTHDFDVEHKKLEGDYTATKVTPEMVKYLEYDLRGHYEVLDRFYESDVIKNAGPTFTMAGQAMRVFRTTLKKPLAALTPTVDEFVRKAYYGGRTEIFKPFYFGKKNQPKLKAFDVNSLYPTCMQRFEMPGDFDCFDYDYYPDRMGYVEADVDVPKDLYVPPLGTVMDINGSPKFIFPTGKFSGYWSTAELEYAKTLGVKVLKTGRIAYFKNAGYLFKDYVDKLYELRQKTARGTADNTIAKLLMNSCYGRFGLNLERENLVIDDGSEGLEPYVDMKTKLGWVRFSRQSHRLGNTFTNVGIAAWVTSLSRIYMHKILNTKPEGLYYTDTDSAYHLDDLGNSEELGGLKFEGDYTRACFLMPKLYHLESDKVLQEIVKSGGVKEKMFHKNIAKGFYSDAVQGWTMDDFMRHFEGEIGALKAKMKERPASLKIGLKKGDILYLIEESMKTVNSHYDKRRIVELPGKNYDTVPWHINNGVLS